VCVCRLQERGITVKCYHLGNLAEGNEGFFCTTHATFQVNLEIISK
jgi:hypothetical protein